MTLLAVPQMLFISWKEIIPPETPRPHIRTYMHKCRQSSGLQRFRVVQMIQKHIFTWGIYTSEYVMCLAAGYCGAVVIIWSMWTPLISQFTKHLHSLLDAREVFIFPTITVRDSRTYV